MTTKRQIKKLLEVAASRHPDLVVRGPFLVLAPLRHVLRSISIDRSWNADYPRFYWHIGHAFNPTGSLQGLCPDIFWLPDEGPRLWSQPGFTEAFIETLDQRIMPMLRRVQTIEDMFHVRGEPRSCEYDNWLIRHEPYRIQILTALGRFEEAAPIYEQIRDWHLTMKNWWQPRFEAASRLGALVAAGDHPAIIALLHQWEDEFVARNRLEDIYERTPFPAEQI
ncbi:MULTISPECIES: hypothetical protein [unclassified Bosea (in: a-proteobacteria)]|uniref:hypothetical protein n=1 Tax=unclassified Bosea (in: a-proteobacteria) TaxID=2653178 RepID=UPI000956BFA5|nr:MULTISPECIES: hypothetical protein [unclassified Bosea (in: a-proteobacteria)]TAJ28629.1 MAG: hypothetical protein EPO59_17945 [Bosea sp. (in: a-proteobacteria)]SIR32615.1 hypothetical protein SAMN05880592_11616 [Bosea sp. TND4EK4]